MLDMLTSFADLVALSPHPYTRPMIHADGPIVVKAGRHPVVSTLSLQQLTSSFVANDLFMSPLENLHVVTGPNGAGKVRCTDIRILYLYLLWNNDYPPMHCCRQCTSSKRR